MRKQAYRKTASKELTFACGSGEVTDTLEHLSSLAAPLYMNLCLDNGNKNEVGTVKEA